MFEVKFTATVVNPDTEDNFNGYIDPEYSMWTLFTDHESCRRYTFDTATEAKDFIESTIGLADAYDGHYFYAADSRMNLETGEDWSYGAVIEQI